MCAGVGGDGAGVPGQPGEEVRRGDGGPGRDHLQDRLPDTVQHQVPSTQSLFLTFNYCCREEAQV